MKLASRGVRREQRAARRFSDCPLSLIVTWPSTESSRVLWNVWKPWTEPIAAGRYGERLEVADSTACGTLAEAQARFVAKKRRESKSQHGRGSIRDSPANAEGNHQSTTDPSSASYDSGLRQSCPILSAMAFSSSSIPSPGAVGRSTYPSLTLKGFLM